MPLVIKKGNWSKIIEHIACIVIGSGVIGLACARAIARKGIEVIILEKQEAIGMETSSRHSEVIHAGIYYPPGTNKAKWCVEGKKELYAYCIGNHIPFKKVGKLIVATNKDEIKTLKEINSKAKANGVFDLETLDASAVAALEPEITAEAALFSPSTGIIDSHAYMLSLLGNAEANGAMLAVNSQVIGGRVTPEGIVLQVRIGNDEMELRTQRLVNSAGLFASEVSRSIIGVPPDQIPQTYYRKGNYFSYGINNLFKHLIYPVPVPGGLGIHSTLDLSGQVRFGPDVEWVDKIDYDVDPKKAKVFAKSIARYYPSVKEKLLIPGYAGIRPTLADKEGGFKDFCIVRHEVAAPEMRFVGLYGIKSPGLTSSLALADAVAALV